jgi:hypothetical protein
MGLDSKVDIQGMLQNIFEQVDDPHFEGPKELDHHDLDGVGNFVIMEVIYEYVQMAFQTIDIIQNEMSNWCINFTNEDEPININGQPSGDGKNVDDARSHNAFNSIILEDVMVELYKGLCSTNLVATILLMNLFIIHGMINKLCDELFTLLHHHLLPVDNSLLVNYHATESLTRKLGLDYVNIHARLIGCVIFKNELANELRCPKCGSFRYKNEENKACHVKVLMHFPIIPRL